MADEATRLDLSREIIAEGKAVLVLPARSPSLAPTLEVTGHPTGEYAVWILLIRDGFGTPVWNIHLTGREGALSYDDLDA